MSIVAWLVLGLLVGFVGNQLANRQHGEGLVCNLVVGITGAVVGGFTFDLVGSNSFAGLNSWSVVVAVAGSIALLLTFHAFRHPRPDY